MARKTTKLAEPLTVLGGFTAPMQAKENRTGEADTVLVVDDTSMVRMLIQEALELFGYRVLTADSGAAALALFRENQREIGCVLIDMNLGGGLDGVQTFEALQEIKPGTKVMLVSGYAPDVLRLKYGDSGIVGFLKKPFQLSTLRNAVKEMLGGAEGRGQVRP